MKVRGAVRRRVVSVRTGRNKTMIQIETRRTGRHCTMLYSTVGLQYSGTTLFLPVQRFLGAAKKVCHIAILPVVVDYSHQDEDWGIQNGILPIRFAPIGIYSQPVVHNRFSVVVLQFVTQIGLL